MTQKGISKVRFKKANTSTADILNQQTYLDYYYRLRGIALSTFEWIGLPLSIDERYLELMLYEEGKCLFFRDDDMRDELASNENEGVYLALKSANGERLNVYNVPMIRRAYASNGYNKLCSHKDSVIIWDNVQHQVIDYTLNLYAMRLAEVERILDVNLKQQKVPTVVITTDNGKSSMKEFYEKVDGNEPLIMVDKNFDIDNYKVLNMDIPFKLDKLNDYKHALWNECMTWLGIGNANTDKKERLISSEVDIVADQKDIMKDVRLNARKFAVKEIKRMHPELVDLDVRFRLDKEIDDVELDPKNNEVKEDLNEPPKEGVE